MRVGITGSHGFIGSHLKKRFQEDGHTVFSYLRPDLDRLYLFGSPSSQVLFKYAPEYCWSETVAGFSNALRFCEQNGVKLFYPSSATVYTMGNDYARCKATLETLQQDKDVLGFRIFAGYGYEEEKGEYASIVYQFCKQMKQGERPIIFGDGSQRRDFIYIDDIVETIVNADGTGQMDVGSGINYSFLEVVDMINQELGTNIRPYFIDKPVSYIEETICKNPVRTQFSLREGIREICELL